MAAVAGHARTENLTARAGRRHLPQLLDFVVRGSATRQAPLTRREPPGTAGNRREPRSIPAEGSTGARTAGRLRKALDIAHTRTT
jgi:hypothetical protein